MENFIQEANKAGVNGFIIPDVRLEEGKAYKPAIEKAGLSLIDFIAIRCQVQSLSVGLDVCLDDVFPVEGRQSLCSNRRVKVRLYVSCDAAVCCYLIFRTWTAS